MENNIIQFPIKKRVVEPSGIEIPKVVVDATAIIHKALTDEACHAAIYITTAKGKQRSLEFNLALEKYSKRFLIDDCTMGNSTTRHINYAYVKAHCFITSEKLWKLDTGVIMPFIKLNDYKVLIIIENCTKSFLTHPDIIDLEQHGVRIEVLNAKSCLRR